MTAFDKYILCLIWGNYYKVRVHVCIAYDNGCLSDSHMFFRAITWQNT